MNNKQKIFAGSFILAILITQVLVQNTGSKPENLIYECRTTIRSKNTYQCNYIEKNSGIIGFLIFVIILLILDIIDLWKNK